jgi:BCD family chlorophyll transporter-like MFS transporter
MSETDKGLSPARNTKIGFFHLGSGMADVLTSGVWNRIMITDLGVSATPVGLLVSLRYFLAPLGVWAGRISDRQSFLGFRRLFWVWLGRLMMVLSTFGLGFGTSELMRDANNAMSWLFIVVSMVLFSMGNAISGSTFLALIYDRANDEQRGRAIGIVWTFLLVGFTVGGILFGRLLKNDETVEMVLTPDKIMNSFLIAGGIFLGLWFFSLIGEERRGGSFEVSEKETGSSLRADLSLVWQNPAMRFFFLFLTLSMFFAFSQDLILEPFGGDVFGMDAAKTSGFTAYWGTASIFASLLSIVLLRKVEDKQFLKAGIYTAIFALAVGGILLLVNLIFPIMTVIMITMGILGSAVPLIGALWICQKILRRWQWNNTKLSQVGMWLLVATFALLTVSAFLKLQSLISPTVFLLGTGLGFWNIGTLGLMMDMSPVGRAGTFLGFWSMSVTLARGGGVSTGGILRDLGLSFTGEFALAYGIAFFAGLVGLSVALWCLNSIHVETYERNADSERTTAVLAGSMD